MGNLVLNMRRLLIPRFSTSIDAILVYVHKNKDLFLFRHHTFSLFHFVSGSAAASVRQTSGLLPAQQRATHRGWGMSPPFLHSGTAESRRRSGDVRRRESERQRLQSAD